MRLYEALRKSWIRMKIFDLSADGGGRLKATYCQIKWDCRDFLSHAWVSQSFICAIAPLLS